VFMIYMRPVLYVARNPLLGALNQESEAKIELRVYVNIYIYR